LAACFEKVLEGAARYWERHIEMSSFCPSKIANEFSPAMQRKQEVFEWSGISGEIGLAERRRN
jgi:hypothetical protein